MASLLQGTSMTLYVRERVFFQRPEVSNDDPSHDPVAVGVVQITVRSGVKKIKDLRVRIGGRAQIEWPRTVREKFEVVEFFNKEMSLATEGEPLVLEKGQHSFAWAFIIPSSLPPTETHLFGRIRYTVEATCKVSGKARTETLKDLCNVLLVPNPGGAGICSPPPPMGFTSTGFNEELGVYNAGIYSAHSMISGLMLLRMNFYGFMTRIEIYSLRMRIEQTISLHSIGDTACDFVTPPQNYTVASIDAVHHPNEGEYETGNLYDRPAHVGFPWKTLEPGETLSFSHLARFPNDQLVRPTTQPGTDTPIRVSHRFILSMIWRPVPEGDEGKPWMMPPQELQSQKKVLSMSQANMDIYSCYSSLDSLTLPLYKEKDDGRTEAWMPSCTCRLPVDALMEHHGTPLLAQDQHALRATSAVSVPPKVSAYPGRAPSSYASSGDDPPVSPTSP